MASKVVLLVLACFLLISTKVSPQAEERILTQATSDFKKPCPPQHRAAAPPPPPPPPLPAVKASHPPRNKRERIPVCVDRCKNHWKKNKCLKACVTCCDRCKCVPPEHFNNMDKCGKCSGPAIRACKVFFTTK